jgi:hypothetical protein
MPAPRRFELPRYAPIYMEKTSSASCSGLRMLSGLFVLVVWVGRCESSTQSVASHLHDSAELRVEAPALSKVGQLLLAKKHTKCLFRFPPLDGEG